MIRRLTGLLLAYHSLGKLPGRSDDRFNVNPLPAQAALWEIFWFHLNYGCEAKGFTISPLLMNRNAAVFGDDNRTQLMKRLRAESIGYSRTKC